MKILIALSSVSATKQYIVTNEGSGKVLNKIYSQWHNIKTDVQYKKWVALVQSTKFGSYGTIPFMEVLKTFAPKYVNDITGRAFEDAVKRALKGTNT